VKHLSSNILFEKTISVLSDEEFLSPTLEEEGRERFCLKLTKYSRETKAEMHCPGDIIPSYRQFKNKIQCPF